MSAARVSPSVLKVSIACGESTCPKKSLTILCGKCKVAFYCSVTCQAKDAANHAVLCSSMYQIDAEKGLNFLRSDRGIKLLQHEIDIMETDFEGAEDEMLMVDNDLVAHGNSKAVQMIGIDKDSKATKGCHYHKKPHVRFALSSHENALTAAKVKFIIKMALGQGMDGGLRVLILCQSQNSFAVYPIFIEEATAPIRKKSEAEKLKLKLKLKETPANNEAIKLVLAQKAQNDAKSKDSKKDPKA